jgi:large subunit ribosomal protein L9
MPSLIDCFPQLNNDNREKGEAEHFHCKAPHKIIKNKNRTSLNSFENKKEEIFMEIILKQTIDNLGLEGEIVTVKPGYARNYLIPQDKAEIVNKASLARLKHQQQAINTRREEEKKSAKGLIGKLESTVVTITRRVGEGNRLFGSVSTKDIADKLAENGILIDRRSILLVDPIKNIGETKVTIKAGHQMSATVSVMVAPEGDEKAEGDQPDSSPDTDADIPVTYENEG